MMHNMDVLIKLPGTVSGNRLSITTTVCLLMRALNRIFKSDGQEISTIEWQELKNRLPSFFRGMPVALPR